MRTLAVEADLATIPDTTGVAPRTVVGLPASVSDPAEGKLRVVVDGVTIVRDYDPDLDFNGDDLGYGSYGGGY